MRLVKGRKIKLKCLTKLTRALIFDEKHMKSLFDRVLIIVKLHTYSK